MGPTFEQIFPEPRELSLEALREGFAALGPAPADRPYIVANFVSSADGHAAVGGRSAPLSDEGDRAMFHVLRESVDAVLAGTGTLRTERYGRLIRDGAARSRRADRGLAPEPVAVVVSRSGEIPYDIPLFSEPEARIIEFTGATAPRPVAARRELISRPPEETTLETVTAQLRSNYAVRTLLCEGGPTLFGALVARNLIDELFLTLSPMLVGGEQDPPIISGPPLAHPAGLRLVSVMRREDSLFLRFGCRGELDLD